MTRLNTGDVHAPKALFRNLI